MLRKRLWREIFQIIGDNCGSIPLDSSGYHVPIFGVGDSVNAIYQKFPIVDLSIQKCLIHLGDSAQSFFLSGFSGGN